MTPELEKKLSRVQLLLLDVDGVLTDGAITYTDSGEQVKSFNSSDGLGIRLLMDAGIQVGIITGRASDALRHRCSNLGITLLFDGIKDKAAALDQIAEQTRVPKTQTAFVGDDLIDLPAMKRVGLAVSVANACDEVKKNSDMTTQKPGGRGAVREVSEAILKAQGLWQQILDRFLK